MKSVRGAALVAMAGVVLALFAERSVAAAPQSYESSPYTLTITFEGLVAFAPTGGPILTGDARVDQLWVLLPAVDGKQAEKAAKKMVKLLKENKQLKVQGSIQGDEVRVTGKNRDDLQAAIALLRREDFGVDLQFLNFRD